MAKFIQGYGNLNYRSLGGDGIALTDLQDINIIIGQNNGGKTNILRSMQVWESSRRGNPVALQPTDYYENDNHNSIEFEFTVPPEDAEVFTDLLSTTDKLPYIRLKIVGENQYETVDSFIRHVNPEQLRQFCNSHYSTSSSEHAHNANAVERQAEFQALFNLPPIIFIEEGRVQATPKSIRDRLEPIWSHGAANSSMRPIKKALREFIEEGMESNIEIQFEPGGESFSIATSDDDLVTFESLGSGFRQIFNLALTIASTKDSIVLIDEPELNMHPSLLRRMMKLIFSNNSNQYMIATHSNVMLDAQHQKSVYQVKGGKLSTVTRCDTVEDSRELLNDLGVKASDLLQTNGIIWVEGPSDRTLIKRWLELAGSEMEEGLDYSFQYYGGKLLAHYSLDDDLDEFVNILEINKNAYLVLDSDWKDESKTWEIADLAPRKKKIIDACKDKSIDYWITRGVEIENYVPDEIWTAYTGTAVSIKQTENVTDKVSKYKIKAKESHMVATLLTKESLTSDQELADHVKAIDTNIIKWNQQ